MAAGADCRFATSVTGFNGGMHLSDGTRIRPKLIIGADGPRAAIGRAMGQVNRALVETRQITVPLHIAQEATDIYLAANIPGGYGWLFPRGDRANLGVGIDPRAKDRLKALLDGLHRLLVDQGHVGTEIFGHTGGAIPVGGMLQVHGDIEGIPALLAGDAAGLTNPVTGAGIASAVISGALAGQAAADRLGGDGAALDDYETELRALFDGALERAVRRRTELLQPYREGRRPSPGALRRGWIAYEEYWAA